MHLLQNNTTYISRSSTLILYGSVFLWQDYVMKNFDKIIDILDKANLPHSEFVDLMENFKNPYLDR